MDIPNKKSIIYTEENDTEKVTLAKKAPAEERFKSFESTQEALQKKIRPSSRYLKRNSQDDNVAERLETCDASIIDVKLKDT